MGIYIGLGANLSHPRFGPPRQTLAHALVRMGNRGVRLVRRSSWYRTAPVPKSDQPWYINAVAEIATGLAPQALLATLHGVEDELGRVRTERNAARFVDLDILDYESLINYQNSIDNIVIPHPRLHARAFVLLPLREISPDWRHPVTGAPINTLIDALPADQETERLG